MQGGSDLLHHVSRDVVICGERPRGISDGGRSSGGVAATKRPTQGRPPTLQRSVQHREGRQPKLPWTAHKRAEEAPSSFVAMQTFAGGFAPPGDEVASKLRVDVWEAQQPRLERRGRRRAAGGSMDPGRFDVSSLSSWSDFRAMLTLRAAWSSAAPWSRILFAEGEAPPQVRGCQQEVRRTHSGAAEKGSAPLWKQQEGGRCLKAARGALPSRLRTSRLLLHIRALPRTSAPVSPMLLPSEQVKAGDHAACGQRQ